MTIEGDLYFVVREASYSEEEDYVVTITSDYEEAKKSYDYQRSKFEYRTIKITSISTNNLYKAFMRDVRIEKDSDLDRG